MSAKLCIINAGAGVRYADMWNEQLRRFGTMVALKQKGECPDEEFLFLVEHHPVITLGRHAKTANLLVSEDYLKTRDIDLYQIERGGDITFHGPGQLVAYPLLDLQQHKMGIRDYIHGLEECVIRTIARYGLLGERIEGATGVWLDKDTPNARKICAIGVRSSRYVTMHGLALNVNTDLRYFRLINPCGFVDKGVTSIALELGHDVDMAELKSAFCEEFCSIFP